jgi:hypothetical protein
MILPHCLCAACPEWRAARPAGAIAIRNFAFWRFQQADLNER